MSEAWRSVPVRAGEATFARGTRESLASDPDEWMYRRLSGQDRAGELDARTLARFQRLARWLYHSNPVARRVCDLPVDYLLGGGVRFEVTADDEAGAALEAAIDRFGEHPQNRFAERLPLWFAEQSEVFGELFLPAFVNRQSGDVALGYLAPEQILEVRWNDENALEATGAVQYAPQGGAKPVFWSVIRAAPGERAARFPAHPDLAEAGPPEGAAGDGFDPSEHEWGGVLFYFRANCLATGRGRSVLEPLFDWVHAYDHYLFNDLRNANLQGAFVWDVECKGLDGAALRQKAEEIRKTPPRPGEVLVHNESERWMALAPRLNASDHTALGTQVKRMIGMGAGLPSHLVAAEDDVNRATAQSADLPFLRRMERRRERLRDLVRTVVDYQLDQKGYARPGSAPPRPYPYAVLLPDVCAEDAAHSARCLRTRTEALAKAIDAGLVDAEEAKRQWRARS